jgi:hypothetical protein
MVKRLKLATRALGAEPGRPDIPELAAWISRHRGIAADIITYQLDQSLSPQLQVGILSPCAGGSFYRNRILECLSGIEAAKATAELSLDSTEISRDAALIASQNKGASCALPAPHQLGITDAFYDDEEEWNDAFTGIYRTLMRSMRDSGIRGHVLICDTVKETEIVSLIRQNVFFYLPEPEPDDLKILLEHQQQVAVGTDQLDSLFDLSEEFDIRKIIIVDPDTPSITRALSSLDPDQIVAGGYCTDSCGEYWKDLVSSAFYMV